MGSMMADLKGFHGAINASLRAQGKKDLTLDQLMAFNPPPKVKSAVIRLVRNGRKELGCDESLFKTVVKTGFNQRRKTLRNSLKPLIHAKADRCSWSEEQLAEFIADPIFELRPERLSVEDFIGLTLKLA